MTALNSHSYLTSYAAPRPTCDAWCVFEFDTGTANPILMSSSGVREITRIQPGVFRIHFTNPERFPLSPSGVCAGFPGSGYLSIAQYELGNGGYGNVQTVSGSWNNTTNSELPGATNGSCDIVLIGHSNTNPITPTFLGDASTNFKARANVAFFSLRADSDIYKPFVRNNVTWSENFYNWTYASPGDYGDPVTDRRSIADFLTRPDGVTGAFTMSGNTYGGNYVANSTPGMVKRNGTFSVYAKAGTGNTMFMSIGGVGNNFGGEINLQTGTIVTAAGPAGTTHSFVIQNLSDGWKRCSLRFFTPNSPAPLFYASPVSSMVDKTVHFWGAQVEDGWVTTPYIKTEGTAPVLGNQDLLLSYSPSSTGFGRETVQNLLTRSEEFTNAIWSRSRLGISAGGYVAPDGTTTAMKLHELDPSDPSSAPTTDGKYYKTLSRNIIGSTVGVTPHIFSIHAKAAERRYISLNDLSYGSFGILIVDLLTGTVTQNYRWTGTQAEKTWIDVRSCGDGWWRIAAMVRSPAVPSDNAASPGVAPCPVSDFGEPVPPSLYGNAYGPNAPGVSGSGILIWGAQLERGHILGDYVRTTTAPVGTTFTRVGVTYGSEYGRITSRQATAWGTIVIPANTGNAAAVSPYLENHYGVDRVIDDRSGGSSNSAFRVFFSEPMDTDSYCIILSNETDEHDASMPVPSTEEFTMLMLQNDQNSTNNQRKREWFSVRALKQTESGGIDFGQRSSFYQSGKTQRIHFMVFGGRAYYGSE